METNIFSGFDGGPLEKIKENSGLPSLCKKNYGKLLPVLSTFDCNMELEKLNAKRPVICMGSAQRLSRNSRLYIHTKIFFFVPFLA